MKPQRGDINIAKGTAPGKPQRGDINKASVPTWQAPTGRQIYRSKYLTKAQMSSKKIITPSKTPRD
ncbi:MAG: hypothetical protein DRR08_11190 [Candidatus Parabeggiatoa sp. nov. 2]|nr:MAG: hypothetical protein B6247_07190 [Beggiatoa sp. 4572_84]RKZ60494.1 MAG: hypothetical protein DRR08_11190 [Gammaproteobacteria bacterium]